MDMSSDSDSDDTREPNWLPPAADRSKDTVMFGSDFEEHFYLPERLQDKTQTLVETVNDFHFAMINDHDRNQFYKDALAKVIKPEHIILEIGAGSGLLSMLAARCNPRHVYAIEANKHLAKLATRIIERNGLSHKITIINELSTDVRIGYQIPERADVLVSEILGTVMLGESALEYVADARLRLLKPNAAIIPAGGQQFFSLVESQGIKDITSVAHWDDLDLQDFNALQDTVSLVFTKQYGFRYSSVPHRSIVGKQSIVSVDFTKHEVGDLPVEQRIRVRAEASGTIHAAVTYWEAYSDTMQSATLSTDPEATIDNFPRDMQWGQAIQLIEDTSDPTHAPKPLIVEQGQELDVIVRMSEDGAVMQFEVLKV